MYEDRAPDVQGCQRAVSGLQVSQAPNSPGLFLLEKRSLLGSCMELGSVLFRVEQIQDQ